MIWILAAIVLGLLALVVLMAVIGLMLRPDHLVARSAVVPRPPADVWSSLIDLEGQLRWRKDVGRIELLPPVAGKRAFREHGRQGPITFVIDEERGPDATGAGRLVTRIADEKLPFGGRWIITVAPDAAGSRVTVTEDGVVKNPIFRFLSRTVFSLSATQEAYLRQLGGHFGVDVVPSPAEPEP